MVVTLCSLTTGCIDTFTLSGSPLGTSLNCITFARAFVVAPDGSLLWLVDDPSTTSNDGLWRSSVSRVFGSPNVTYGFQTESQLCHL